MNTIGMIGLGAMGHSIARNILNHGYSMVLYDLRPEAMEDLLGPRASAASSPQELGRQADTVLVIVNTFPQCRSVVSSLLETMEGGVILNMSTIAMDEAKTLGELAAAKGVGMLDCPVSGGTAGAREGTLTVMAAGEDTLLEAHRPLLSSFASNIVHVGREVGQGQAVKAINQLLVGVHMCAAAEAFTLAQKCGLDLQMVYDTIRTSAGNSRIFENRGQFLIDRDFSTRSTLQIQLKDTDIACRTAGLVGAPSFLCNTARELFKLSAAKFPPTQDSIAVAKLYEELCGLEEQP